MISGECLSNLENGDGSMNHWAILLAMISLPLMSCGDSNFSAGGGTKKESPVVAKPKPEVPGVITEVFTLDSSKRTPVDLVWVIDNSGSMTDNIAQVRKNFDAFMASLSASADVKVILLSQSTGTLGLKLPASAKGGSQIEVSVGSWDPASIAAAASCPADALITGVKALICGVDLSKSGVKPTNYTTGQEEKVRGKVLSQFREGAARSYIFVTDDDSISFKGENFVAALKVTSPKTLPKVYSFRGIQAKGAGSCQVSNVGTQYEIMEKATGGKSFDICSDDWSSSFSQLADSIVTNLGAEVLLKGVFEVSTVKVFLDGVELPASEFVLTGAKLALKTQPDLTKTHEIKVTYTAPKAAL